MKYRDTYRIVTQVSRYVSRRDFRYRATPSDWLYLCTGNTVDASLVEYC